MADSAPTNNDAAVPPVADAAPAVSTETKHEDKPATPKGETKSEPEAAKAEDKSTEGPLSTRNGNPDMSGLMTVTSID